MEKNGETASSMKIEWENPWESRKMMEDTGTLESKKDEDQKKKREPRTKILKEEDELKYSQEFEAVMIAGLH